MDNVFNLVNSIKGDSIFKKEYEETVAFVDFTQDGSKMIAGCLDNKIYVYDYKDEEVGKETILEGPEEEITWIETHNKANFLLTSSIDGSVWMWNLNNGKVISTFYGHQEAVNKASFTPNKRIASISDDCSLKVWKVGEA